MVAVDVCGGALHCNGERRECCNASSKPDCVAIIVRDKWSEREGVRCAAVEDERAAKHDGRIVYRLHEGYNNRTVIANIFARRRHYRRKSHVVHTSPWTLCRSSWIFVIDEVHVFPYALDAGVFGRSPRLTYRPPKRVEWYLKNSLRWFPRQNKCEWWRSDPIKRQMLCSADSFNAACLILHDHHVSSNFASYPCNYIILHTKTPISDIMAMYITDN